MSIGPDAMMCNEGKRAVNTQSKTKKSAPLFVHRRRCRARNKNSRLGARLVLDGRAREAARGAVAVEGGADQVGHAQAPDLAVLDDGGADERVEPAEAEDADGRVEEADDRRELDGGAVLLGFGLCVGVVFFVFVFVFCVTSSFFRERVLSFFFVLRGGGATSAFF